MILLVTNVYSRQESYILEGRNDEQEIFRLKINQKIYNVGDFIDIEEENQKWVIKAKASKPKDFLRFFKHSKQNLNIYQNELSNYINQIQNYNLKIITKLLIEEHQEKFYLYPAAKSIHHDYIGGLLEHTVNMLKLADTVINLYENIDRDLLYAGIILHDLGKIYELENYGLNYTTEGNLIGHIVIMSNLLYLKSSELKIVDQIEIIKLNHIILAHHGKLEYGSPKEPLLQEAEIINLLDNLDAKVNIIQKELQKESNEDFTESIFGLDKRRFYKK